MRNRWTTSWRRLLCVALLGALAVLMVPPGGGRATAQSSTYSQSLTLPMVANAFAWRVSEPHPFGAQMYGVIDGAAQSTDLMRQARLHWVRYEVNWGAIVGPDEAAASGPNPPYNWYPDLDASLRRAHDLGLELIVTFANNPVWASMGEDTPWINGPIVEEHLGTFANMVAAMATRYPPLLRVL